MYFTLYSHLLVNLSKLLPKFIPLKHTNFYAMNDLYLIGNGFDLAHGLKTSYNDFLLWYLNDFLKNFWQKDHFEDELMKIDRVGDRWHFPDSFDTISNLIQFLEQHNYERKANHDFFENIIKNYREYRWVDIEYEYYSALVKLYKEIELNPQQKESVLNAVKRLNNCFELIKKKLVEYLDFIDRSEKIKNEEIGNILFEGTGTNGRDKGTKMYVCFNYTLTLENYTRDKWFSPNDENLYIHGVLKEDKGSIIFGYGDEIDPFYEKIENLNLNDFLMNIKSFSYFKSNEYQRVVRFVNSGKFVAKILGHSCGLSDRILLNTIFEHPNCLEIKIYYYQKNERENDYFEKTLEISRHFKPNSKGQMRVKIMPFNQSVPIPQNPKES